MPILNWVPKTTKQSPNIGETKRRRKKKIERVFTYKSKLTWDKQTIHDYTKLWDLHLYHAFIIPSVWYPRAQFSFWGLNGMYQTWSESLLMHYIAPLNISEVVPPFKLTPHGYLKLQVRNSKQLGSKWWHLWRVFNSLPQCLTIPLQNWEEADLTKKHKRSCSNSRHLIPVDIRKGDHHIICMSTPLLHWTHMTKSVGSFHAKFYIGVELIFHIHGSMWP